MYWAEWTHVDRMNVLLQTWDDAVGGGKTTLDVSSPDDAQRATSSTIALLLSVFGTLVMLNMLIAVMSDRYRNNAQFVSALMH